MLVLTIAYLGENQAADSGGAMFIKIRSHVIILHSTFKFNKVSNRGGSILVQHSNVIIQSCAFLGETAVWRYGGAISAENVANVTVLESSFHNCTASFGGSLSARAESVFRIKHSDFVDSFAIQRGGGIYIYQNSSIVGNNFTMHDGKSIFGGSIHISDSRRNYSKQLCQTIWRWCFW